MKLSLNKEYARRHLFVAVLSAGMCLWFAYDGLVKYPSMSARELYASIEKADPPKDMADAALEAFKAQKTKTQHGFALFTLAAALVVGLRLLKSARFRFEFDEDGFADAAGRLKWDDVDEVDDRDWEKKGITRVVVGGRRVVLDAWHHVGVKEFHKLLLERLPSRSAEKGAAAEAEKA